jgi:hypothetical protein
MTHLSAWVTEWVQRRAQERKRYSIPRRSNAIPIKMSLTLPARQAQSLTEFFDREGTVHTSRRSSASARRRTGSVSDGV